MPRFLPAPFDKLRVSGSMLLVDLLYAVFPGVARKNRIL
jgi:hypothetical protein